MDLAYVFGAGTLRPAIEVLYAGALCYGCVSDINNLKIPNAVSAMTLALFFLNFWLLPHSSGLPEHLLAGGLALLAGFAIYSMGFMGAGDVKLIAALMLWAGPQDALAFLIVMSLVGGLVAGLLLATRKMLAAWPPAGSFIPSRRVKNWAARGILPYGIAICAAGLIMSPSFFSQSH